CAADRSAIDGKDAIVRARMVVEFREAATCAADHTAIDGKYAVGCRRTVEELDAASEPADADFTTVVGKGTVSCRREVVESYEADVITRPRSDIISKAAMPSN